MPRPKQREKLDLTRPSAAVTVQFLSTQGEGDPHPVFRRVAPGREDDTLGRGGNPRAGLIAFKIHRKQSVLALDQLAVIAAGHGQEPGEFSPIAARGGAAFHIHDGGDFYLHPAAAHEITGNPNPRHPAIHHHRRQIGRRAGAKARYIRPIRQNRNPWAGRQYGFLGR